MNETHAPSIRHSPHLIKFHYYTQLGQGQSQGQGFSAKQTNKTGPFPPTTFQRCRLTEAGGVILTICTGAAASDVAATATTDRPTAASTPPAVATCGEPTAGAKDAGSSKNGASNAQANTHPPRQPNVSFFIHHFFPEQVFL